MRIGLSSNYFRSALVVVVTWTLLFGIFSGSRMASLPLYWALGLFSAIAATAIGISIYLFIFNNLKQDHVSAAERASGAVNIKLYLSTDPTKSETRDLEVPFALKQPVRKPLSREQLALLRTWKGYDEYVKKHPTYARAFNAVAQALFSKPVAASHVEGGHAGLSLVEHSLNVVRAAAVQANKYRYYGLYRNGKLVKPVQDPKGYYAFPPDDPLIPLVALAHDIGKLVSYDLVDGKTVKVMEAHDTPGRRLLNLIPEIYALPVEDKHALMIAVGVYHHIHGGLADGVYRDGVFYSDWMTDRIYAVTHFLEYIDIQTGRVESGGKPLPFFVPDWDKQRHTPAPAEEKPQSDTDMADRSASQPSLPSQPEADLASKTIQQEAKDSLGAYTQWFMELLRESSARKGNALAHRYGDMIFVDDTKWRAWVRRKGKPVANPESLMRQPSMGVIHPVTAQLLKELAEHGWLVQEVGGKRYSPINALYNVRMERKNGEAVIRKFVIIVSASIPGADSVQESSFPLVPERSSFGEQRAMRSKTDDQPAADEPGDEPAIEDVTATPEDFLFWLSEVQSFKGNVSAFPEKSMDGSVHVFVDTSDLPEHFQNLDMSLVGGKPVANKPGMIAIPVDKLNRN